MGTISRNIWYKHGKTDVEIEIVIYIGTTRFTGISFLGEVTQLFLVKFSKQTIGIRASFQTHGHERMDGQIDLEVESNLDESKKDFFTCLGHEVSAASRNVKANQTNGLVRTRYKITTIPYLDRGFGPNQTWTKFQQLYGAYCRQF